MSRSKTRRLPSESRKFGSMRVLADGRVRFSAWTVPGLPDLDFVANHRSVRLDDTIIDDPVSYAIEARWRGRTILFFHVTRRRVATAVFPYNLSPDELQEAVAVLRGAGGGVERWITPGLAHLQADLAQLKSSPQRRSLMAAASRLLDSVSVRRIPIARAWRSRRDWERWKRAQRSTALTRPG